MVENIRLSFQGIWAHKMRSFLTMLGIIIGIASIIAIVSTIKGTSEQIKDNLVGSGSNTVEVKIYNGNWEYISGNYEQLQATVPKVDDSIKKEILELEEVSMVSAYRTGSMYDGISYQGNNLDGATIEGIDDDYFVLNNYVSVKGRQITQDDRDAFRQVVILDSNAEKMLFNGENSIGKTIEIKGDPYVVIGVVEKSEDFTPVIENINDWYSYYGNGAAGKLFVPDNLWPMIYGFDEPYNVVVKAANTEAMTDAGKKTADILNKYIVADSTSSNMNASAEGEEVSPSESTVKYKSDDLLEKAKALQEVSNSTSKQLIWIASISLIVGGIGVMNIMLVSVTERTKEIGLKKALGARKKIILGQFLTEAAVLTSLGGVIGVAVGVGLAYMISSIAEVPVKISGVAIIVSVVFSMVIGIVFGFIPSVKAANLNPIDALRYE